MRLIYMAGVVALGSTISACAGDVTVTPIREEVRLSVKTIAAEVIANPVSAMPVMGARGSREGSQIGARGAAGSATVTGSVLMGPLSTLIGAIGGAISAESAEAVDAARAGIQSALDGTDIVSLVVERLRTGTLNGATLVAVEPGDRRKPLNAVDGTPVTNPLRLTFDVGVRAFGTINPDIMVTVSVDAALWAMNRTSLAHQGRWTYCSALVPFIQMGAEDGARVRAYILEGARRATDAVLHDLLRVDAKRHEIGTTTCTPIDDVPRRPTDPPVLPTAWFT
ncbi:MAG: hypothetical protein FJX02_07890 [Alphaproteobacteria bacterium]|nr:hypothetical protein [Alphaproteobacteria bacterium]